MNLLRNYFVGYVVSLLLTLAAVSLFYFELPFAAATTAALVVTLALAQFVIQVIFFLHLGQGEGSHANVASFALTAIITLIIVTGTLWIMAHLDHNMLLDEIYPEGVISPYHQHD